MRQMQTDNSSEIAQELVPDLLKINIDDPDVREAQELLQNWDFVQDADSAAAAYFNAVWRNIVTLAFGNKLPKELRVEGQCLWVDPASATNAVDNTQKVRECGQREPDQAQPDGGDRWFQVVRNLMDKPDSDWWTTPEVGTREGADHNRDDLLKRAMVDARWELTAELGKDIDTWSWGRLHRLFLKNQTLGTSVRSSSSTSSTAARGSSAAARRRSTRPAGTPRAATTWCGCRRCGWWSTSTTSTSRSGSTSPVPPGTPSAPTTRTRPVNGPAENCSTGRSRRRPSTTAPATPWCSSPERMST